MPANPTSVQEAREDWAELLAWAADGLDFAQDDILGTHDHIDAPKVERLRQLHTEIRAAVRAERDAEIRGMVEGMRRGPIVTPKTGRIRSRVVGFNDALSRVLALLTDREGT